MQLRGAEGLSYQDLAAYEAVTGMKLSYLETTAMMAMDKVAAEVIAAITKENMKNA